MPRAIDLSGRRFGRLLVVELAPPVGRYKNLRGWLCVCDCGNGAVVRTMALRHMNQRSCGCLKEEARQARCTSHGEGGRAHRSREYRAWKAAKERCYQPKHIGFREYGGRGIRMCEEWLHDFPAFLRDMGRCPPGLTLDRMDVNGNYEKGNCRWATLSQQVRNRRPRSEWPSTIRRAAEASA